MLHNFSKKDMKQVLISLFLMAALSAHGQSRVEQISDFLDGIINFEEAGFNEHNPILTVNSLAAEQADEVMQMTESNIGEILEKGREFSHCLITVDQHTVVLITDWDNCKQSGSWNTCMPYGIGFIQRGELESHEDYINNIIGTPDAKRRTAFFFE